MDGAEVSVLKESHKVSLASLLKSHHSRTLESQVSLEVLSNLTNQPLEGQLSDQQLCGFLVPPDLPESNCARPVAVGLLHTPSCRSRFASSLGCQLGAFPPVDFLAVCLVRAMLRSRGCIYT